MEQYPHVWIQLPLDAPCIPGRRCEQENISAQQILWLRFLGPRYLDLPAWGGALQGIGQSIHYVLRVTASRGKDDMEDSTLNEVRDSLGSISGVVHESPHCSSRHLQRSDGNSFRIELVHQIPEFVPPLGDVCRNLAIAARSEEPRLAAETAVKCADHNPRLIDQATKTLENALRGEGMQPASPRRSSVPHCRFISSDPLSARAGILVGVISKL